MGLGQKLSNAGRWTLDSVRGRTAQGPVSKKRQYGTIAGILLAAVVVFPNNPSPEPVSLTSATTQSPAPSAAWTPTPTPTPTAASEPGTTPRVAPTASQTTAPAAATSKTTASAPAPKTTRPTTAPKTSAPTTTSKTSAPAPTSSAPRSTAPKTSAPATKQEAPGSCTIKGNITSEKIYHVKGQRDYDKTIINTSKGERWFCSESEAKAAGWRKAKQ